MIYGGGRGGAGGFTSRRTHSRVHRPGKWGGAYLWQEGVGTGIRAIDYVLGRHNISVSLAKG